MTDIDKALKETWDYKVQRNGVIAIYEIDEEGGLVEGIGLIHPTARYSAENEGLLGDPNEARARIIVAGKAALPIIEALVHAADNGRADSGAVYIGDDTMEAARALLAALREDA